MVAQIEAEMDDKVLEKFFDAIAAKGADKIVVEIKDIQGKIIIRAEPTKEAVVTMSKSSQ